MLAFLINLHRTIHWSAEKLISNYQSSSSGVSNPTDGWKQSMINIFNIILNIQFKKEP